MHINEGDWTNSLYYKYYGPVYESRFSFTEREQAYIQDVLAGKKKITVTALGDRIMYTYRQHLPSRTKQPAALLFLSHTAGPLPRLSPTFPESQLAIVDALSRDYINVFAIDVKKAFSRVIKTKGYVDTVLGLPLSMRLMSSTSLIRLNRCLLDVMILFR